jgi:hypothetical protein
MRKSGVILFIHRHIGRSAPCEVFESLSYWRVFLLSA